MISLIVGAHFRPPAKLLLEHLPSGCQLRLLAEPDNPYDEHAIRVLLNPADIPTSQHGVLEELLPAMGFELSELLQDGPIQLGYVAASGGKPLRDNPGYVGNQEFQQALDLHHSNGVGSLGFSPEGKPTISIDTNSY